MRRRRWTLGITAVLVLGTCVVPEAGAAVPLPPPVVTVVNDSATGFTLSWTASPSTDITGYQVQRSQDGGGSWQDVADGFTTTTQYRVSAPPAGHATRYRVVTTSAGGTSEPTEDIPTYTAGQTTQSFIVRTAAGRAVTNGMVSWSGDDGVDHDAPLLDSRGMVTLRGVPAGISLRLRVDDATIGVNQTMGKTFSVDFGTATQTLVVPPPPPMIVDRVTVTMPGGIPAVGVEVNADHEHALLDYVFGPDGFFYSNGNSLNTGRTDAHGVAVLRGWSAKGERFIPAARYPYPQQAVNLIYDDGKLQSESLALLTGTHTALQIAPLPYTTGADPAAVAVGDTAPARFRVHAAPTPAAPRGAVRSAATRSLSGVRVTLRPPAGWRAADCRKPSSLTGVSNAAGYVTLRVCAARSARFTVRTRGALPSAPIAVTTRQSTPGAPESVRAVARGHGRLRVSWGAALYTGGARVTSYRLTATSVGHRTVSWTAASRTRTHTFVRLARRAVWTIRVVAVNAHGAGQIASARAKVR